MKLLRGGGLLLMPFAMLHADVVIPNGPWQTVTTPTTISNEVITSSTTNGAGNAYWNNSTHDSDGSGVGGDCLNVGCILTGGPPLLPESPVLVDPVYLGNDNGSALLNFYFQGGAGSSATISAEVAGLANANWFGWYQQGADLTGANRGTAWDVVFDGGSSNGAASTFTPTANFGLWFLSGFSSGTATDTDIANALNDTGRFTESSRNGVLQGTSNQYFAAFARSAAAANTLPGDFWVGVEDVNFGNGADRDYNDMIVNLRVVPEPRYYIVLAAALLAVALVQRRMKKRAQEA